jgi:hypothetical protein
MAGMTIPGGHERWVQLAALFGSAITGIDGHVGNIALPATWRDVRERGR